MNTKMTRAEVIEQIKGHVKGISGLLVGCGVGAIMGNILKEYRPDARGLQKMVIRIGAVALTGMVIKSVNDYVNSEIDEVFDLVNEIAADKDNPEKEGAEDGTDN